jgi:DNA-binding transcriptional ArsR family regulator
MVMTNQNIEDDGVDAEAPGYEMEESFEATEPEHFRAVADPTRQKILQLLRERAATTKQLATAFGMKPGAIGHHLKVLEEVGFVRVVKTRQVRAITEKYYGNTYRRLSFTARHFSWSEEIPEISPQFHLEQAMAEFEAPELDRVQARKKDTGNTVPMSSLVHARIPPERAEAFARKVTELSEEFDQPPVPGEKVYAFIAGVFPTNLPEIPDDERDDESGG